MCYVPKTIIYNTKNMAWCNENNKNDGTSNSSAPTVYEKSESNHMKTCPSCGHQIQYCQDQQAGINDLPGLPAGVKFDPSDQEILEHLEGKVRSDVHKHHPLIDEFIHTIVGDEGICYTHPEKLPGVSKDGLIRHYFHRPSKAYMTGTRKRRKVQTDEDGSETRWHKTGKTRPIFIGGQLKGHKKILVLYSNYGKKRKPEKTNWVMHQYHLGNSEEEKDGELVVSKVFYQTQPRQSGSGVKDLLPINSKGLTGCDSLNNPGLEYYTTSIVTYDQGGHARASRSQLVPNFIVHHSDGSSFLPSQCCVKESG